MSTETKSQNKDDNSQDIQLFVQGEGLGEIRLVKINARSSINDLFTLLAKKFGGEFAVAAATGDLITTMEDDDKEIRSSITLKQAGITDRTRVHIHRCRKIKVSVNFNSETIVDNFPPSTTVGKVKKWADKKFDIDKIDATEHALQLCGTSTRPDEDTHIGTLTKHPSCSICFDLVPKKRVEGALI